MATHPHPSQGILATSMSGVACLVYYLYSAAQAVVLAAHAAGTPFDPRSLDIPSIGALVVFYHACLGFPVKQTWLDAIKSCNCDTFDGLTYLNAARYCPDADQTIMGHLAQQRQKFPVDKTQANFAGASSSSASSHYNAFQPSLHCHKTAQQGLHQRHWLLPRVLS